MVTMLSIRILRRHFFASATLQVRTSRAKQPLSLKKKDVVPATTSTVSGAQNNVPAVPVQQQGAQPPQPYYQPAPAPTLGQSIMDGFSFGIGSAIARRLVDSIWPGGGGDGAIAGGEAPGQGLGSAPPPPPPPASPSGGGGWGDTQYSEDPFDDSGDGGDEDEF